MTYSKNNNGKRSTKVPLLTVITNGENDASERTASCAQVLLTLYEVMFLCRKIRMHSYANLKNLTMTRD